MPELDLEDVRAYVKQNIGGFHNARLESLRSLRLEEVLRQKNPYLFKAKNMALAQDLVRALLDARLSSQEEAMFGDFLEGLAIFVSQKASGGRKSTAQGVDLEFDRGGVRYILAVKSGPNWGNSSQVRKMRDDFKKAARTLRSSNSHLNVVAVNGCCYGRSANPDKGDYFKYCGQAFWEFVSGNPDLYLEIIEPLGHEARERNTEFAQAYAGIINRFTKEFSLHYVKGGQIDWASLVRLNSAKGAAKAG